MPIITIGRDELSVQCASCEEVRTVKVKDLVMGTKREKGDVNPDILQLPLCPCGRSREALLRNHDHCNVVGMFDTHRRAVNALSQLLEERGQVERGYKAGEPPQDMMELPEEGVIELKEWARK